MNILDMKTSTALIYIFILFCFSMTIRFLPIGVTWLMVKIKENEINYRNKRKENKRD